MPRARLGERLAERGILSAAAIPDVLTLQQRWGCRFGEALVAEGAITSVELAETLADGWGLSFVDLIAEPPDASLSDLANIDLYLRHLFLPWRTVGDAPVIACADPSAETRQIIARLYGLQARVAMTGKFDILWTAQRQFRDVLVHDATFALHLRSPAFSAREVVTPAQCMIGASASLALVAAFLAAPQLAAALAIFVLALCYGVNIWLRVLLFLAAGIRRTGERISRKRLAALDEATLPAYSILVPLYDEAHMVAPLAQALRKIDYPAAKLDIKLVLEEDDTATIETAKSLRLDGRFEILCVPRGLPRTKPRACNYGLRFARGDHVVIYDAEDRPEPDQLKKAVAAFRSAPSRVVCFQARLNVYNADDNWLTRMFALEYGAWFDFLLPGLGRLGFPVPLGGTSNHFRTESLRRAGGWDAFNVTEDADLGVRLARLGYRVRSIDSSTYEEAVPTLGGWVKQRSRWLKGYMQTCLVHLRDPRGVARSIGVWPFWGFVIFMAGAVATSLLSPLFWILAIVLTWTGSEAVLGPYGAAIVDISYLSLIAGNGLLTLLAMLAPLKRRWFHLAPCGATVLVYWLLISLAAYRALGQLVSDPFHWEKTQHGYARARRRRLMLCMLLLASTFAVAAAGCAFANPWTKDMRTGELISNLTFTRQPGLASGAAAADATSGIHAEYGAHPRATLIVNADVQRQQSAQQSFTNFDNASAGVRLALVRWDFAVLSAELAGGVSGVRQSALSPSQIALNGRSEARLMFGQGFDVLGRHGFATIEGGWRWRGGGPANELLFDAGLGIAPWPSALLMLQSFSIIGTGRASGLYRRYDQSKLQLSIAQRLGGRLWLQAGVVDAIAGADAGQVGALFAVWWQF